MDFFVNNAWEILENYLCTPNQLNMQFNFFVTLLLKNVYA